MRTQLPVIFLLLAILSAAALRAQATGGYPNSGWNRIKQAEDYHRAQDVAHFAIAQHNRQTGEKLEFVRLYRGYISGKYYRLYFQARDDTEAKKCETVVFEKVPKKVREVIYFKSS